MTDKTTNDTFSSAYNEIMSKYQNNVQDFQSSSRGTTTSFGESESFRLKIKELEAEDKDKERNTPKVVRWFGTGDTLKAVIIWSIAILLAIALLIAMLSKNSEMVKAIIPALSTTVGFLVGSRA